MFIYTSSNLYSDDFAEFFEENPNDLLVIRLKNGDLITGILLDFTLDSANGNAYKFKTQIGTTEIYGNEIKEIQLKDQLNRHRHRSFIMPTAEPIGNDHFISNYLIAMFYGGFGVYDILSVTVGTTLIPTVDRRDQASVLNIKATVLSMEWDEVKGGMSIALGANLAFINNKNKFSHLFGNVTIRGDRTDLTAMVFVKTGEDDFYDIRFNERVYPAIYFNNSFGIGLGMTTKFSERHDLYFVGELWNTDIARITNTALLGAVRIQNSSFSADFGLMFFTSPALIPVVNFSWTPF